MKKIIVFLFILFAMGCTDIKEKKTEKIKKKTKGLKITWWEKEVDSVEVKEGINLSKLSWNIEDRNEIEEIQVYRKDMRGGGFKRVKTLKATVNELELKEGELASVIYKLRLISKDGKRSKGKNVQIDFLHKSVIRDSYKGRKMLIYLPKSYENSDKRYPVVYMHDGQNIFSKYSGSPEEWQVDEVLDELVAKDQVEEMIVVGIYSTETRAKDYVAYKDDFVGEETPGAKEFSDFVVDGIIPYIDSKYRTIADRENRAVMGSSYGGILSLWMGYNYPEIFSMIGGFSASLFPGDGAMIDEIGDKGKLDLKIWLDRGGLEFNYYVRPACDKLLDLGYIYGEDFVYLEDEKANHDELAWASRIAYPLIMFKGKKTKTKALSMDVKVEVFKDYFGILYQIVNPVIEFDNGMKYSAYKDAEYTVLNSEDGSIGDSGLFEFNNEKDLKVKVKAYGFEKEILISNEDIQKRLEDVKYN